MPAAIPPEAKETFVDINKTLASVSEHLLGRALPCGVDWSTHGSRFLLSANMQVAIIAFIDIECCLSGFYCTLYVESLDPKTMTTSGDPRIIRTCHMKNIVVPITMISCPHQIGVCENGALPYYVPCHCISCWSAVWSRDWSVAD